MLIFILGTAQELAQMFHQIHLCRIFFWEGATKKTVGGFFQGLRLQKKTSPGLFPRFGQPHPKFCNSSGFIRKMLDKAEEKHEKSNMFGIISS